MVKLGESWWWLVVGGQLLLLQYPGPDGLQLLTQSQPRGLQNKRSTVGERSPDQLRSASSPSCEAYSTKRGQ